jgi:lipopolysaccharide/colanic/teichoic acid biosynthesis glycosyltransferase
MAMGSAAEVRVDATLGAEMRAASSFRFSGLTKQDLRIRFYVVLPMADLLGFLFSFAMANEIRFGGFGAAPGVQLAMMLAPIYFGVASGRHVFGAELFHNWRHSAWCALASLAASAVAILLIGFYLQSSAQLSRIIFSLGFGLSAVAVVGNRFVLNRLANRLFEGSHVGVVVLLDGCQVRFDGIGDVEMLEASDLGFRPDVRDPLMLDALGRFFRSRDRVIIACAPDRRQAWAMVLKGANIEGEIIVPEIAGLGSVGARTFAGAATLLVSVGPLSLQSRAIKRLFDLAIALSLLIWLAPLLCLIAVAIRLESRGSIFFVQPRLGRGNRLFSVYKFRSLRMENCDASGAVSTSRLDARFTRVGKLIRATSLDELPQLFNVVRGDMSLVGPRPHALGSLAGEKLFWEIDERYWHRHAMKPGITGLAQVRGFRGSTEHQSDLVDRLQSDLDYLNGWTIWRDIRIILSTFRVVVHPNAF